MSFFLMLGLVSGSGGLNWWVGAGIIGPILFSTSKKVFIFLIIVGCGQLCTPGHALNQLGHSVPSKNVHPLH